MRKVVVGTFLTLDGVMQAPGGPDEDREGGFQHGGWSVNYWDDLMGQVIVASTLRAAALLLGRKTYDIFAAHWPNVSDEDPVGAKLNSVQKYVASRTPKELTWKNSTLITGDVVAGVQQLKQGPGDEIQVHGSGDLTQTLLRHGVVDELRLWVFPIALGTGKRLFGDGTMPSAFKLVGSKTSTTGVVISTYQAAGAVAYGSFEVDERGRTEALWRDDQRGPATR